MRSAVERVRKKLSRLVKYPELTTIQAFHYHGAKVARATKRGLREEQLPGLTSALDETLILPVSPPLSLTG
jgi:hypothetical protein